MTREELTKEISVLDNAKFFYQGEIYDENLDKSIGYIPDLVYYEGKYIGFDLDSCSDLCDYLQIDVEDQLNADLKRKGINPTTEEWMAMYAKVVKNLLTYLINE